MSAGTPRSPRAATIPRKYSGGPRPPPVPARVNDSRVTLERAGAIAGIDDPGARLLRVGSNAVYRLQAPVIARISRPGTDPDDVRRTVAVARWLKTASYPAVRVMDVDQPVTVDGRLVRFWEA